MTKENPTRSSGGILRTLAYLVVIIFFGLMSVIAYTLITGANRASQAVVQPIGDLVRQLVVPVTPVILPDPVTIVQAINDLTRLETASFEFQQVVTAETNREILWGALGESIIFVGYGKVYAGVDLARMSVNDLQVLDPVTVQIHLPPAEIFADIPVLDTERSYVADRNTGILKRADPELETQVRRAAEQAIKEAAAESQILARADYNAQEYMRAFLQGLGFTNVIFMASPPEPAPPYVQPIPKGFAVTPQPGQ
jgi:hypothetical protein